MFIPDKLSLEFKPMSKHYAKTQFGDNLDRWNTPEEIHQLIITLIKESCLWGKHEVSIYIKNTQAFMHSFYNLPIHQVKKLAKIFRLEGFTVKVKYRTNYQVILIQW